MRQDPKDKKDKKKTQSKKGKKRRPKAPKPSRVSAGLLMYRHRNGRLQVFLGHPGGPYFTSKDEGAWTIPKGEVEGQDDLLLTACREFQEETGIEPHGPYFDLGQIQQRGGKIVHGWAFEGDHEDDQQIVSNTFTMEWPPHSGRKQKFPELDRAVFFDATTAREKIKSTQAPFIDTLEAQLRGRT